jgi:hypothetical protein
MAISVLGQIDPPLSKKSEGFGRSMIDKPPSNAAANIPNSRITELVMLAAASVG